MGWYSKEEYEFIESTCTYNSWQAEWWKRINVANWGLVWFGLEILYLIILENWTGHCFAAYTLDEVDEKTKALRASTKYTVDDDASALDVSLTSLFLLWIA